MSADSGDISERLRGLDALVRDLERLPDAAAAAKARAVVAAVLELHGAGLARLLAIAATADARGAALLDALSADELVASLLLLHGLHPVPLADRARTALDRVQPRFAARGLSLVLVGADGDRVSVRVEGAVPVPRAEAARLQAAVEEAILATAPDASAVVVQWQAPEAHGFVPIERVRLAAPGRSPAP